MSAYWISDAIVYPVSVVANWQVVLLFVILGGMDLVEWLKKTKGE